jgi:hypothetical protein
LANAGVAPSPAAVNPASAVKPDTTHDTYYLSDYLSTTIGTVNAQGVIDQMETDAFGAPLAAGRPPARFTGKPYDEDMGNQIRWYHLLLESNMTLNSLSIIRLCLEHGKVVTINFHRI